ncbi:hypothetical protein KDN32_08250 [Nocardioides sp. J2M5]|uniref:hypothetical protein n=1 Tax=Nocardioides palaemonis TaxID=2829810 RepID=UPI001BA674F2|nr:hypothetical protein [Nocardioides palaemonis]MBS2937732.1 hypothetical protein [Nocardioides palaemonis]
MATPSRRLAQLLVASSLAVAAVAVGGGSADADPPRAWTGGVESDFGRVWWVHEGSYAGAPGNWHLGDLTIEEDDDVLTGSLVDWSCPDGARPPDPLISPVPPTSCTIVGGTYVEQLDPWDIAVFDHATNRLRLSGDFREVDASGEGVGTVPIDVTLVGTGSPEKTRTYSAGRTRLTYEEYFPTAKAWGRFDGHRVGGPRVTQSITQVSFYIRDMVRAP